MQDNKAQDVRTHGNRAQDGSAVGCRIVGRHYRWTEVRGWKFDRQKFVDESLWTVVQWMKVRRMKVRGWKFDR
jgi:hypothetical protein